jgi:hypothetical protein
LNSLSAKNDPYEVPMIKGNCLEQDDRLGAYLQGGSGYLISRAAATKILHVQEEFFNATGEEDVVISRMIVRAAGVSFS